VSDIIGEIAGASQEQSAGIEQVNKAVMQLDEMTQQNAALVEQASAASQSMASQAKALNEMMERYEVTKEATAAAIVAMAAAGNTDEVSDKRAARAADRRMTGRPWKAGDRPATPLKARIAKAVVANGTDNEWTEF
jgi:methyl-accepting chemotaxis protein